MTQIAVNRFVGGDSLGLSPLFSSATSYNDAQQLDVDRVDGDVGLGNERQQGGVEVISAQKDARDRGSGDEDSGFRVSWIG